MKPFGRFEYTQSRRNAFRQASEQRRRRYEASGKATVLQNRRYGTGCLTSGSHALHCMRLSIAVVQPLWLSSSPSKNRQGRILACFSIQCKELACPPHDARIIARAFILSGLGVPCPRCVAASFAARPAVCLPVPYRGSGALSVRQAAVGQPRSPDGQGLNKAAARARFCGLCPALSFRGRAPLRFGALQIGLNIGFQHQIGGCERRGRGQRRGVHPYAPDGMAHAPAVDARFQPGG